MTDFDRSDFHHSDFHHSDGSDGSNSDGFSGPEGRNRNGAGPNDGGPGGSGPSAPGAPGGGAASEPQPGFFTDFVDLVYGIFVSPVKTLREVVSGPRAPVGPALFAYFLAAFINALGGLAELRAAWPSFLSGFLSAFESGAGAAAGSLGRLSPSAVPAPSVGASLLVVLFIVLPWGAVGLFFKTGALSLMGSLFGARERPASRLLPAFAVTYLPSLVGVPFALLSGAGSNLGALGLFVTAGILIWRLVLDILALREWGGLESGRAVAAALTPLLAFGLLAVLAFAVGLATILGAVAPLIQSGLSGVG